MLCDKVSISTVFISSFFFIVTFHGATGYNLSDMPEILGVWYVNGIIGDDINFPQPQCWIVNITESSSNVFTGVSTSIDGDTYEKQHTSFTAIVTQNLTMSVVFDVFMTSTYQSLNVGIIQSVGPGRSLIWRMKDDDAKYCKGLVVSRNRILSEEARKMFDLLHYIENINCQSSSQSILLHSTQTVENM